MSHAGLYHEVSGGDEPTELEAKEGGHINSQAGLFHSVGGQRRGHIKWLAGLAHSVGGLAHNV